MHTVERHPQYDWWLSVRCGPDVTDQQRRSGDVIFGVIAPFEFPNSYYKLRDERFEVKRHRGLKDKPSRLSWKLCCGIKSVCYYFTPYDKTVQFAVKWKKIHKHRRKRQRVVKEYGRRYALIVRPRIGATINKYGYIGG